MLGRGANASVLKLDESMHVYLGSPAPANSEVSSSNVEAPMTVSSEHLAIKFGSWPSQAAFEREVQIQRVAAEAGLAPKVFFSRWLGPVGRRSSGNRGMLGMQCLSQPTFFTWLRWLSKEISDSCGKTLKEQEWHSIQAI